MSWWGLSEQNRAALCAVVYITSASPPDSITWLSKPDAEKLGIEVSLFNTKLTPNFKSRDNAPAAIAAYVVQGLIPTER